MIFIGVKRKNMECGILLRDFVKNMDELLSNCRNDKLTTILSAPHDVVLKLIDTMVKTSNSHATSVAHFGVLRSFIPALRLARASRASPSAGFPVRN